MEEDRAIAEDHRTMNILKDVAGSIYKCVQFTIDCPSMQEAEMVPILDLKVYVKDN